MDKIDFVLTWVDGSDPAWLAEKHRYEDAEALAARARGAANSECRYRDYGTLRYWFRSVERFAPWVNRIFFVTCGQKPDWLDVSNPKLRLVDHRDYIPAAYLPTFHSDTIELNLHRIKELSEQFVLFNDDVFLLRPAEPERFFKRGIPVLPCDLGIPRYLGYSTISRVVTNNSGVLRRCMNVERLVWKHMTKFADVRALGVARAVKNFVSFAVNRIFIDGMRGHLALSHLKSTFEELWRVQPDILDSTSRSRFRNDNDINHWIACDWNMVSGRFYPINEKSCGRCFALDENSVGEICETIRGQKLREICINDVESSKNPEKTFAEVSAAFSAILPDKSTFEK